MENLTTIIFCRHGEVDNPSDIAYFCDVNVKLSVYGHEQMQKLGETLKAKGFKPSAIYASTLIRAVESAKEIAKSFPNTPIIEEENLKDSNVPGISKRTSAWIETIEQQGIDVYSHKDFKDVAESRRNVVMRMLAVLTLIKQHYKGETIIIVSHGDSIALLRESLLNPNNYSKIPEIKKKGRYLQKGEAWEVVFDNQGKILEEGLCH